MPLIVVMEDDAGTRMLVASVLKKDGYEVLTAENGALGLQLVRGGDASGGAMAGGTKDSNGTVH